MIHSSAIFKLLQLPSFFVLLRFSSLIAKRKPGKYLIYKIHQQLLTYYHSLHLF